MWWLKPTPSHSPLVRIGLTKNLLTDLQKAGVSVFQKLQLFSNQLFRIISQTGSRVWFFENVPFPLQDSQMHLKNMYIPLVDLYLISEKSIWKNQVWQTGFLVYFKLDFNCLCSSLKKSISNQIFVGWKSSLLNLSFPTWFFKTQVQINRGMIFNCRCRLKPRPSTHCLKVHHFTNCFKNCAICHQGISRLIYTWVLKNGFRQTPFLVYFNRESSRLHSCQLGSQNQIRNWPKKNPFFFNQVQFNRRTVSLFTRGNIDSEFSGHCNGHFHHFRRNSTLF